MEKKQITLEEFKSLSKQGLIIKFDIAREEIAFIIKKQGVIDYEDKNTFIKKDVDEDELNKAIYRIGLGLEEKISSEFLPIDFYIIDEDDKESESILMKCITSNCSYNTNNGRITNGETRNNQIVFGCNNIHLCYINLEFSQKKQGNNFLISKISFVLAKHSGESFEYYNFEVDKSKFLLAAIQVL